jgi:subtilisin family serine protease
MAAVAVLAVPLAVATYRLLTTPGAPAVPEARGRAVPRPVPPPSRPPVPVASATRPPAISRGQAAPVAAPAPVPDRAIPLPDAEDAIAGEYTLTFFNARDRKAFEALVARYGIRILDRMEALHALRIAAPDAAALRSLLAAGPRALTFAPNTVVRIPPLAEGPAAEAPATPYTGFGADVLRWLGVPDPQPGWGGGVLVAVLDTGFPGNAAGRLDLTGEGIGNAVHGGAVASLITGLQGMAPGSGLLDIKVLSDNGQGDAFTLARGILEAVDRGAGIINICAGTRGDSPALAAAVAYALARNVLIIASSGNDGLAAVSYPAGYDGVLAVGGVDAEGRHLYFSNTGTVDISAPGIGLEVPGAEAGQTVSFSGTSAATPLVTAAAALLRAESPQRTPAEITALLKLYSNDAGEPGPDDAIGAGILDAGRLLARQVPGVVDVAAIRPYLRRDAQRGLVLADVFAQNQGTVALPLVEMILTLNGEQQVLRFADVGIGATLAHTVERPAAAVDADGLDITVAVHPVGLADVEPGNNTVRTVLLPSAP